MSNYYMPVKAIKRILKEENEDRFRSALSRPELALQKEFWYELKRVFERRINVCQSYDDLELLLGDYFGISLSDWVQSL